MKSLTQSAEQFHALTEGQCRPQNAALTFMVSQDIRALDQYFPIVNMLSESQTEAFHQLIRQVAEHPHFDLRLIGKNKTDLTHQTPNVVRYLIAGHLAEVFFFRQNLLARFLHTPRHFQIYVTPEAFQLDGGVSGGCYSPSRQSIQLVMSRLFEGFNGTKPGVCPFLHELGHMLDHFDAGSGSMGRSEGLYPGLSPRDGEWFNPRARELFIAGKRIELDRYRMRQTGDVSHPMPIGHPYVFQNDGEFLAGYLEMFFRNPHYFAAQNPDLYAAYCELFGYDPRNAWTEDFPHYVNANRSFYLSGQTPSKTRLTIPKL
ncbi:MAG: zinc-dependent peptidase [Anaerolineales bacterium]|nr:zinc-dependent peptidase [Anaerolineales bacterium]